MATYAIGDVQGCCDALRALLGEIGFSPARDTLWFVGDLVNRGTQSAEVLRFVRSLGERAIVVHGNHDLHALAVAAGKAKRRRDDTLEDLFAAPDRDELLDWLRQRPLLHVDREYVMVHAGLLPSWTLAQAAELAAEVEAALRAPDHREFYPALYGAKPAAWSDTLRGPERLRVIVNAMTRMRFCTPDGAMEFSAKGDAANALPGYLPWFDVPGRKTRGVPVVCGHWSALGLRIMPDLLALDTGCVWGGRLTAVRLEDRRVFQTACANAGDPARAQ